MTFKHVKFEDSVTMRSLERVAKEKGWVKEEPIAKTASFEGEDLSVSINLTENIMKLCSGLRSSGFNKYADEIEHKYMNYKKAQSLYETSKETGEDLVDAAHPKGSHKLEGVDSSEAVVETIIDRHLATVKMVEKKPTGKLASASDILNAVKVVLARNPNEDTMRIHNAVQFITQKLNSIRTIHSNELTYMPLIGRMSYNKAFENWSKVASSPNEGTFGSAMSSTRSIYNDLQRSWTHLVEPVSEEALGNINALFESIWKQGTVIKSIIDAEREERESEKGAAPGTAQETPQNLSEDSKKLDKWIANASAVLSGFESTISTDQDLSQADKNQAMGWIQKKKTQINAISARWQEMTDPQQKEQSAPGLLRNLTRVTTPSFGQFKKEWID